MGRLVIYVLGRVNGALLPSSPLVLVSDRHQVLAHCPSQLSHSVSGSQGNSSHTSLTSLACACGGILFQFWP